MKKLIMCDLDNTLLPIYTQEMFAQMWLSDMAKKFYDHGLNQAIALNAMNEGLRAMVFNSGEQKNIDRFYDVACEASGYTRPELAPVLDDYYRTTFENVRDIARENPYAPEIARLMREKATYAVIATMPMFPTEACDRRMRWVGLNAGMFDLVTAWDFSSYCKPNPGYYREILDHFGVRPDEALMIGNDVREDMRPCAALGIDTFLVTDHIITHDLPYDGYRRGSYPELTAYLNTL